MANNIFIDFLPPWIETGLQPAFYDKESGTVLQQTARMYAKVNELTESVNDYIAQFIELHDYVHDYFDNLDVQEEINNKLDQMAEDGTLTALIENYVSPYIEAQNSKIDALESNISSLSAGSPVFVSSTSEMTDPTKIYILNTNGNIYYYDGTQFTNSGISYGADALMFTGYTTVVNSASVLDSFDNAVPNRVYCVTAHNIPNQPSTKAGSLITFRYIKTTNTQKNGTVQLYVTSDGLEMYERLYWGDSWKTWQQILPVKFTNIKQYEWVFTEGGQVSSTDDLDDFDNAKFNRCYLIFATDIGNQPVAEQGTLITFRHTTARNNYNGFVQIFISKTDKIYHRFYYNNYWHSWQRIVTGEMLPYGVLDNKSSISLFRTVGVIGDSFASGWLDSAEEGHRNRYSISWLQIMARKYGFTGLNLSTGGLSTRTWLTSDKGLTLLNSSSAQELYLIALGINDIAEINNNNETLGTIADIDIDHPDTNPNSFYGNFGKILSAIKTKAPNAKIVLITIPKTNTGNNKTINDAIIEIGQTLSIPVIVSHDNPIFTSTYFTNQKGTGGHPTAPGYGTMADSYGQMLDTCIATNYNYFKDFMGSESI